MANIFFPQYKKGKHATKIRKGNTILRYARKIGLEIASNCGGRGECGECVVRIEM